MFKDAFGFYCELNWPLQKGESRRTEMQQKGEMGNENLLKNKIILYSILKHRLVLIIMLFRGKNDHQFFFFFYLHLG